MIECRKLSRNIFGSWLCIGVAFCSFASAQSATPTEFDLPLTGITFVGASNGRAVAGTLSLLGCSWLDLGPSTLTSPIDIHGTVGNDTIRVVDTLNVVFCNRVLQPIAQNGNAIQLYGGDGDDSLFGGGYAPFPGNPNWIFGEAGNDTLYLGVGGVRGEGGPGDDRIYGSDSSGDQLIGGAGNDVLCEHVNAPPLAIDGGDGVDTSCSPSAGAGGFTSIEIVSCLACGFGY